MTKLLLFDFDGVLVDSLALYEKSVNVCLERIGHRPIESREAFLELFDDNFYSAIAKRGIDTAEFMKASKSVMPTLDYGIVRPVPGLLPVVRDLRKRGIPLVIISSNASGAVRIMLEKFGFDGCFDDVLGADFNFSKIEKIDYALRRCGAGRDLTFYIGDTRGDIREAREAGVKAVAVTWGWHTRQMLEKEGPDHILESPRGLLDL